MKLSSLVVKSRSKDIQNHIKVLLQIGIILQLLIGRWLSFQYAPYFSCYQFAWIYVIYIKFENYVLDYPDADDNKVQVLWVFVISYNVFSSFYSSTKQNVQKDQSIENMLKHGSLIFWLLHNVVLATTSIIFLNTGDIYADHIIVLKVLLLLQF